MRAAPLLFAVVLTFVPRDVCAQGNPLGPEFRVNTYTPNNQAQPSLAADPLGTFVVVWESSTQDGSDYGIFGQRYRPILPVELMKFRVE